MLIIRSGRNPDAIFLLSACVLTGIAGLVSPQQTSPAVAHVLAPWQLAAWYAGLALSAAGTLAALALRGPASLTVERVTRVVLISITAMYTIAVIQRGGVALSLAATVTGGLCVASLVRIWQISRDLKKLRRPQGER